MSEEKTAVTKTDRQLAEETLEKVGSLRWYVFLAALVLWSAAIGHPRPDNSAIRSTQYRVNEIQRRMDDMKTQMDRMEKMLGERG